MLAAKMAGEIVKLSKPAYPTIEEMLKNFPDGPENRLSAKTFQLCKDEHRHGEDCVDGNAPQSLLKAVEKTTSPEILRKAIERSLLKKCWRPGYVIRPLFEKSEEG